jgi:hypothetical protein
MLKHNVLTKTITPKLILDEFIESSRLFVEEYSCSLCEGILNECVIDKCGHSFCKECIEIHLNTTNLCPYSNKEIIDMNDKQNLFDYLSYNRAVNSVIEKQQVYCKNKNKNCEWVGKLVDRKIHLLHDCEKEIIQCEYSTNCKVQIMKENFAQHLQECPYRTVLCQHCHQYSSYNAIEQHYKTCPSFPSPCPNNCDMSIPSCDIPLHIQNQCLNTTVDCPFKIVGCSFTDLRRELKLHLDYKLEEHLKLINNKVKSLEDVTTTLGNQIKNLQKENSDIKIKNDNFNNLLSKNRADMINYFEELNKKFEILKLSSIIPLSNYTPSFNNYSNNDIFVINDGFIIKTQDNFGWYGISTDKIVSDQNKITTNIKIIQTNNSCIFFGITLSDLNSPVKNGFYTRTEDNNLSYMLYLHNCTLYNKGVSLTGNGLNEPTREGDIISLILDINSKTISFKRNGVIVIHPKQIEIINNYRFAIDMCDFEDEILFLPN